MNSTSRFYKENGKWYIDLPNWTGFKANLQMVEGADTLLELMADGEASVDVQFSEDPFEGANCLQLVEQNNGINILGKKILSNWDFGADYIILDYEGHQINHSLWLCNVTKFVFGYFPYKIFFKKA